jgi:hypothetical protein
LLRLICSIISETICLFDCFFFAVVYCFYLFFDQAQLESDESLQSMKVVLDQLKLSNQEAARKNLLLVSFSRGHSIIVHSFY